ncbi:hypothetical protein MASR2M17_23240 [Aminivibrio sp.]
MQIPEFPPEASPQGAVEGAERFVEEQQLAGSRPGQGPPAGAAPREAGGVAVLEPSKASSVRAIRWLFFGPTFLGEGEGHILRRSHGGKEGEALKEQPHPPQPGEGLFFADE